MGRISYNIDAKEINDVEYLMRHLIALQPAVTLVMDGLALADRVYREAGGIVIHRNFSRHQGDEWRTRSVEDTIARWQNEGYRHIVRYTSNEPHISDERLPEFIAYHVELCIQARTAGFTIAVNPSYFEPHHISSGMNDPLIRAVVENGHYWSNHDYTPILLALTGMDVASLLDRNLVQRDQWPTKLPFEQEYPPFYHLLRAWWVVRRCDYLGIDRVRIVSTEGLWDNMDDVKYVTELLKAEFGIPELHYDFSGIQTNRLLWQHYWPDWTFEEAAFEQLKWVEMMFPPEYIGMCLFVWDDGDWGKFNFSGLHDLHRMLETMELPVPELPVPELPVPEPPVPEPPVPEPPVPEPPVPEPPVPVPELPEPLVFDNWLPALLITIIVLSIIVFFFGFMAGRA